MQQGNRVAIVIMTGNIGSGKSTKARELAKNGFVAVDSDAITTMISGGDYTSYDINKKAIYHAAENAVVDTALKNNFSVVVDRTGMRVKDRKRFIDIGLKYNVEILSYDFGEGTKNDLQRRIKDNRGISAKEWEEVFERMRLSYEKPTKEEGFSDIKKL